LYGSFFFGGLAQPANTLTFNRMQFLSVLTIVAEVAIAAFFDEQLCRPLGFTRSNHICPSPSSGRILRSSAD
jgi:hypothetical protein